MTSNDDDDDDDVKEISPAPSDLIAGMMSEVRGAGLGEGVGLGEAAGWFSQRTKETKLQNEIKV